jgi:uncharacterized damage-inducible protein DinB
MLADEATMLEALVKDGRLDMAAFPPGTYKMAGDVAEAVARGFEKAGQAAAAIGDAQWDAPARLMMGSEVAWETTRGKMAWGFLLDLIHHRGQLTVYLRPMGAKVPAIYGPSADENG